MRAQLAVLLFQEGALFDLSAGLNTAVSDIHYPVSRARGSLRGPATTTVSSATRAAPSRVERAALLVVDDEAAASISERQRLRSELAADRACLSVLVLAGVGLARAELCGLLF